MLRRISSTVKECFMTLKARCFARLLRSIGAAALLALTTLGHGEIFAQDAAAPAASDQPATNIQELRAAIRRLKERVETFSDNQTVTPETLENLRTEALGQVEAITQLQRDLGIEPEPDDIAPPAQTAENRRLQEDLDLARQEIAVLERQRERNEVQRATEHAEFATRIEKLELGAAADAKRNRDLHAALIVAEEELLTATKPSRDPADVTRIEQIETRLKVTTADLEAKSAEIARIDAEGETLRADLDRCALARDDAEARAEIPEAIAWRALRVENEALQAENVANDQRLAEALTIAERCVSQTGGNDNRLDRALRQIEALEAALALERAATR
jgi:hypothetical protein